MNNGAPKKQSVIQPVLGVLAKHRYLSAGTFTDADADKLAAEYPE